MGWAQAHDMTVVGYSTLSGWPFTMRALDDPHVHSIAAATRKPAAAVLLRHAMQHGLAVIPSSSSPERLQAYGLIPHTSSVFAFLHRRAEPIAIR